MSEEKMSVEQAIRLDLISNLEAERDELETQPVEFDKGDNLFRLVRLSEIDLILRSIRDRAAAVKLAIALRLLLAGVERGEVLDHHVCKAREALAAHDAEV